MSSDSTGVDMITNEDTSPPTTATSDIDSRGPDTPDQSESSPAIATGQPEPAAQSEESTPEPGDSDDGDESSKKSPSRSSGGGGRGWRVKLYQLCDSGKWDDRGTGYAQCKYLENMNGNAIQVVSEHESAVGKVLLESKVVNDDIYRRQGDTIITWKEPGSSFDLALSFQEASGCQQIWEQLCTVQGRVASDFHEEMSSPTSYYMNGSGEYESSQNSDRTLAHAQEQLLKPLSEPTFGNLDDIYNILNTAFSNVTNAQHQAAVKEFYTESVLSVVGSDKETANKEGSALNTNSNADNHDHDGEDGDNVKIESIFLSKLLALFDQLEDLENIESLHTLHKILKMIALLNDPQIYETMLEDKFFTSVVGIFEYDPELPWRPKHREFLANQVRHKQVVPIKNEDVLHKIHQNFRISFLRDVLLPRALDEHSFATLTSMDLLNSVDITTSLHGNREFMTSLFAILRNPATKRPARQDVVAFLQELCTLAKKLQVQARNAFYRSMMEHGGKFFDIFETILADPLSTAKERLLVADILMLALQHESSLLRNYILQTENHPSPPPQPAEGGLPETNIFGVEESKAFYKTDRDSPMLFQLIKRLVSDPEPGMQAQSSEIVRFLLDPETMEVMEKDKFLSIFYDHYLHWLLEPLNWVPRLQNRASRGQAGGGGNEDYVLTFVTSALRAQSAPALPGQGAVSRATSRVAEHHICDLLSFCVQTHGYRIKCYTIRNNVIAKVLRLLQRREKHLVLDAIRFVRTCIGIKDEFYNRYIVHNNLFTNIFTIFALNGPRNNLINSAIIELLEFVRSENIKSLISHIVENYSHVFQDIQYVDTYQSLKNTHDENNSRAVAGFDMQSVGSKSTARQGPPAKRSGEGRSVFGERRSMEEDDDDSFYDEDQPTAPKQQGSSDNQEAPKQSESPDSDTNNNGPSPMFVVVDQDVAASNKLAQDGLVSKRANFDPDLQVSVNQKRPKLG